jgi:DNA primase
MSSPFEEIRRQLDIVEVISEYLPLKRVGNSYSTRCPFHPDDTPSFYVSPSRGIWKCFGCGKGGDVIKFVAEYENISYLEAAKLLAERYNLDVDFGDEHEREHKYHHALRVINGFYREQLIRSSEAKNFLLKERKIPPAAVEEFGLGFAGDGYKAVHFARKEGIFEPLKELKHFYKTAAGTYRDFFHDRITIPIKNILGKFIAYGGRSLKGEQPKYKNSPNSIIFQKEKTLFGIDRAKELVKGRDYMIIVEGYFDVIRLHISGFGNSVAPLGTAFTEHQARVISKLVPKVVLLFDGDNAGKRAAISAAKVLVKFPVEVFVAFLPSGEDPDSFVLKEGIKALRNLLQSAKPVQFLLLEGVKNSDPRRREAFINIYRDFVKSITDPVKRELWIKDFRDKTGIDLFGKRRKSVTVKGEPPPKGLTPFEVDFLLGLFYLNPEGISLEDIKLSAEARKVAEAILSGAEKEKLPKWLFTADTINLERRFEMALEHLSIEKPLLEETFKELYNLERKIKSGKASAGDMNRYITLIGSLSEGEKNLYRKFKETQTL